MAGVCLPTACLRPSARGARCRTWVLAGAARVRFAQHVHLALAALVALGSLRAAPPEDSARAELVIDTPAAGAAVLRPWQSVCGRILRHRRDPPLYLATSLFGSPSERVEAREEIFVIDGAMSEDDSEFEYRISLQTEDGTEEDSVQVAFRMTYSVGEDVKRWMRAGVLDRFKLLSPPDGQPAHKLWQALPPLPATLLSHGGVVRWSRERAPLLAGALLHLGTWPSLADVVLVEGSDLGECKARGYECVPIPDGSCRVHHAHDAGGDGGASSDGEACGWSVEDSAVVRRAAVLFVPCTAVDLVQDRVLPLLEQAVVLVSSEPDWGEGGGWPVCGDLDSVNFRFRSTAVHHKVLRWFATGLSMQNRKASPLPAPLPHVLARVLTRLLSEADLAADGGGGGQASSTSLAPQGLCAPPPTNSLNRQLRKEREEHQASQDVGAGGWLWIPGSHSLCASAPASRPAWLVNVPSECCQVPGRAGWREEEHAGAGGEAAGEELMLQAQQLVSVIRRHRFCLLTEMEATEHYLVWLCLQLGIHSQKSIIG